jgi:translation initiation factor IF-2
MSKGMNTSENKVRPPVVVVLGHVDHGKTTILDQVRKTNVIAKESGGITQHIGAYQTTVSPSTGSEPKKLITFLDTPGHEAFTAIRSRGAKVADIAILVVAADEGVKLQTKEAIKIIKDEKIQTVVAINKIDKEGANAQKVKQELAAEDILVEDWGGKIPVIEVSAKDGKNMDELLNMVLLVAEIEELKEDLSMPAEGVIIESHLDQKRGYVATALIQKGILELNNWIVVGTVIGKVRSMEDYNGDLMIEARPSQPVLITGWSSTPTIGQKFVSTDSKKKATIMSEDNADITSLLSYFKVPGVVDEGKKMLNIIFKTDVSSSLEAIESSLGAIKSDEVGYKVVGYDIGSITETDIKMAVGSGALIVGFRVKIESSAKTLAEKEDIKINTFDIIYELIECVRKELAGLLEPEIKKNVIGKLKVLATFKKDSRSQVIGGKVTSGKIIRGALVEVFRGKSVIANGKIGQLQHNKDDVAEVKETLEAGIRLDLTPDKSFGDVEEGDVLEVYQEEKIERSL